MGLHLWHLLNGDQPIPAPGGKSPGGPHTHVLPRLPANGRNHAATVPVPKGWLAGMTLLRATGEATAFDPARCHAFQALTERYGDPALMARKRSVFSVSNDVVGADVTRDARRQALGLRIRRRQSKWLESQAWDESNGAES